MMHPRPFFQVSPVDLVFSLPGLWGKTSGQHFGLQEIGHVFQRLRALSEDVQRFVGAVDEGGREIVYLNFQLQLQLPTSCLCLT